MPSYSVRDYEQWGLVVVRYTRKQERFSSAVGPGESPKFLLFTSGDPLSGPQPRTRQEQLLRAALSQWARPDGTCHRVYTDTLSAVLLEMVCSTRKRFNVPRNVHTIVLSGPAPRGAAVS